MRIQSCLVLCAVVAMCACSRAPQELNAAAEASYAQKDYEKAFEFWSQSADQGDAIAQNKIGNLYFKGEGVPQDKLEAMRWYRRAAEKGLPNAQANIGNGYFNGNPVALDYVEALKWYRLAADQGYPAAQLMVGFLYYNGKGVAEDKAEAAKWYRLAAQQGLAEAQLKLGLLYSDGDGVAKDSEEALKWVRMASEQGYKGAMETVALLEEATALEAAIEERKKQAAEVQQVEAASQQSGPKRRAERAFEDARQLLMSNVKGYDPLCQQLAEALAEDLSDVKHDLLRAHQLQSSREREYAYQQVETSARAIYGSLRSRGCHN